MMAGIAAASLIYYSPGQIAIFIEEVKTAIGPTLIGLGVMGGLGLARGMYIEEMIFFIRAPLRGLMLGAANYVLGATLIHCGLGQMVAFTMRTAKKFMHNTYVGLGIIFIATFTMLDFILRHPFTIVAACSVGMIGIHTSQMLIHFIQRRRQVS
jgi:hypothetical protein